MIALANVTSKANKYVAACYWDCARERERERERETERQRDRETERQNEKGCGVGEIYMTARSFCSTVLSHS